MNEYFQKLNNLPSNKVIKEMLKYAETNKIPIINEQGLALILQLVDLMKPKRFLEIGTAIGYCSINLATYNQEIAIDTIEKNNELYEIAIKNVNDAKLSGRINVLIGDALSFDTTQINYLYDIIFIDAAKAQYIHFFEKYAPLLNENGVIICDNLLFHGLVEQTTPIVNKNLRHLVEKIRSYNAWLAKQKGFRTTFLDIGDGMSITSKVKK